jgi:hypothetical protein
MFFVQIGTHHIAVAHIIEINIAFMKGGKRYVRISTAEIIDAESGCMVHDFVYGSPEADAIISWVSCRSELLA